MRKRMVTIATFDQPMQARLAENVLKEAGIPAIVADETIVAMDWLLANAVGGIKVQVWEEDAERAVAALERELGEEPESLDDEDLAAEAEEAEREDGGEQPRPKEAEAPDLPPEPLTERDGHTRRVFFVTWFSIVFWPLGFYALYLLLKAATGPGKLTHQGRYNLVVAGVLLTFPLGMCSIIIYLLTIGI